MNAQKACCRAHEECACDRGDERECGELFSIEDPVLSEAEADAIRQRAEEVRRFRVRVHSVKSIKRGGNGRP